MPGGIEGLVIFLWEIDAWPRLKRIRVHLPLYQELLQRMNDEDRPLILDEGKPQAFLMGVPIDCDPTLTNVAFELDYAP